MTKFAIKFISNLTLWPGNCHKSNFISNLPYSHSSSHYDKLFTVIDVTYWMNGNS